ncbi:MAG: autotransporter-associated beta strand repeat-containing protein [Phycisphaerales bacterium]|nr:autotransporter-associated beta strand repeat-containing protein [Phycisphaerales bacterium]MCB9864311.1 autotransporter-associated beta strand repeat-containing protein [Phycisphaerales bacterium]
MNRKTNSACTALAVSIVSWVTLAGPRAVFAQVDFQWQGDGGNNNWQNHTNWSQDPGNGDYPNATNHHVLLNNTAHRFDVDLSGSTRTVGDFVMASFSDQQYRVFNGLLRWQNLELNLGPNAGQIFDVDIEQYADGTWDFGGGTMVLNGQLLGSSNILFTGLGVPGAVFKSANPYDGEITLEAQLRIGHSLALQNASVVLAGANELDVTTNNVNATLGALSGTGNLNIGATTMSVGNKNLTTSFSGLLSGTGTFTKIGTATQTLTGAVNNLTLVSNTGTGTLNINGGGSFQAILADNGTTNINATALDLTAATGNVLYVRNSAIVRVQNGADVELIGGSGTNRVVITHNGALNVLGSGTTLIAPRFDVGPSGSGSASATVQSSAVVDVGELRIGDLGTDDGASGSVGAVSGGSITADTTTLYRRGSLDVIGGPVTTDRLIEGDAESTHTISIGNSGAGDALIIGVNGGDSAFNGLIQDAGVAGSIQKVGAGTLTLGGANTFSGGVTIDGGTLAATNAIGSATGAGGVTVNSGGTLGGTGSVAGTTAVQSGGTVAPGASISSITVDNVTFADGSMLDIEVREQLLAIHSDKLVVNGTATLGGTLNLTSLGGSIITGNTFVILTAGDLIGTFDQVNFPPGPAWSIEYDVNAGEIRVGPCFDLDGDGVCNNRDICPGFDDNADADGDGVPDGCEAPCGDLQKGDADGSGVVDIADVAAFSAVILNSASASNEQICASDLNEDGTADGLDIQGFVELIVGL